MSGSRGGAATQASSSAASAWTENAGRSTTVAAHPHIAPEHLELAGTIDEEAPPGALGLVADEHHGVPAVWAQVGEVVGTSHDRTEPFVGLAPPHQPLCVDDEHIHLLVSYGVLTGGSVVVSMHADGDVDGGTLVDHGGG